MAITIPVEAEARSPARTWQTWHLFVLASVLSVAVGWIMNERLITPEVYAKLLGAQFDTKQVDDYFNLSRKLRLWGYLLQPMIVLLRISFVALLLQTTLLISGLDVRIRDLFRVATLAFIAMPLATASQAARLAMIDPTSIALADLSFIPGALSNILDQSLAGAAVYQMLSLVNVFEMLWCAMAIWGLITVAKVRPMRSTLVVGIAWTTMALFQWGVLVLISGINK